MDNVNPSRDSQALQKFDASPLRTAISLFSMLLAHYSRVSKVSIFVTAFAALQRYMAMQRLNAFHYGTAFFSSNCDRHSGTNPTCWSFQKFRLTPAAARSTATSPCNLKRRILRLR